MGDWPHHMNTAEDITSKIKKGKTYLGLNTVRSDSAGLEHNKILKLNFFARTIRRNTIELDMEWIDVEIRSSESRFMG